MLGESAPCCGTRPSEIAMSKCNNVNPDHYKVAGRERPGKDVAADLEKQKLGQAKALERKRKTTSK